MTRRQLQRRAELLRDRPADVHPLAWIRWRATSMTPHRQARSSNSYQAHQRRVSTTYHRLLKEAGYVVES